MNPNESFILVAQGLHKAYGPRVAIKELSFSLNAGRILGFLGPNGAGKTTAIRILTTMLEPDAGQFIVDGIPSTEPEKIRQKIGVLPENLGFPKQMTGIEYLTYFGQLYGRSPAAAKALAQTLLEEVGMQQRARSLIGAYSHGMRQRIGIARALINDPVVVFLDEPTLGLDPRGQQELLALIRRVARERRVGVILCSHALPEIEGVCDDVVILSVGQVVATGPVADVIGRSQPNGTQGNRLRLQVPPAFAAQAQHMLAALPTIKHIALTGETSGWLKIELVDSTNGAVAESHRHNNSILQTLIQANIPILGFGAEGSRLQDVFMHLTEEDIQ
jgi:ABC-2 type transport system ATP-binding protein